MVGFLPPDVESGMHLPQIAGEPSAMDPHADSFFHVPRLVFYVSEGGNEHSLSFVLMRCWWRRRPIGRSRFSEVSHFPTIPLPDANISAVSGSKKTETINSAS